MHALWVLLQEKWFLWILFVVNVAGTIYGYIWYDGQLSITPDHFLIFVPDSPTASLFFCFVLAAFLLKKNWGLMESLAIITLFKYGIWAVIMNLLVLIVSGDLHWTGYMLMASHFAMALQGLLYAPFYRIKWWHFIVAAIWTLHNDVIDYVFMMYPVYSTISMYVKEIGYFTFWLTLISLFITYWLCLSPKRFSLTIKK